MSVGGWLGGVGASVLVLGVCLIAMRFLGRRRTRGLGKTAQLLARENAALVHAAGEAELAELQRTEAAKTVAVLAELSEEVNDADTHPADVFNRRR